MKLDLRKTLLAGTALVAVGAFVAPTAAHAQTAVDAGVSGTWSANADDPNLDDGTLAEAVSGADLGISGDGVTVTITNDGTADDGSGNDAFTIGTITDTSAANDGALTIDQAAGAGAALTVDITAASVDGNVLVQNDNASNANADVTVTVVNGLTIGGDFDITNEEDSADGGDIAVSVGGDLTVTGATTVTANAGAGGGALSTLTVSGNATFTGGLTLDTDTGAATLVLDSTTAGQTVSGAIAGDGDILITNTYSSGVTFTGANTNTGTITVNSDGNAQAVAFQGDVSSAIALGDNDAGTADAITATIGSSSADIAVSGAITGGASEAVAVNFAGGNTVTLTGAVAGADTTSVTGNTTVTTDSNFASAAITIASGSTFETTANTVTGDLANAGTISMAGGDITGNITGAGTLAVSVDGTLTGSVANTVTIADGASLTVDGTTGNEEISGNVVINDSGVDDGLFINDQGNTISVSGNVTTGTTAMGLIDIADSAGTVAFTGNVGTSSKKLGALTVNGGTGNTVTSTGNLYVDAITLNDADTLALIGTSAQTVSGTITDGILVVGDGTTTSDVTFGGAIASVVTGLVNDNASATFSDDATFTTSFTADGTAQVAQGKTLTAPSFAAGAAEGTIELVIGNTSAGADESATLASGAALDLDLLDGTTVNGAALKLVKGTGVISSGDEFLIGDGTGTVLNMVDDTGETVADNFALFDFTLYTGDSTGITLGDDSDIVAVISAVSSSSVTTTTNNANAADAVLAVTDAQYAADTQLAAVYDSVAGASAATIDEIVEATQPAADAGHVVGALNVSNQSLALTSQRMAELRHGNDSGMAAGNGAQGLRVWAQGFAQSAEQDRRDGIDGYDTDTYGFAAGLDTANLSENGIVGLAFSYGDTDVESDNANLTDTEIDSYQFTLYGDYDLDDRTYLNGMVAYAHQSVDTTRHNVGGVANLDAYGDFDADLFQIQTELGRDYAFETTTITPNVMANYVYYDADDYTETGAGGAGLVVDNDDVSVFELGLGVDASWEFEDTEGGMIVPEVRVGLRHDLIGDEVDTTSTFIGGTTAFKTEGMDPAQTTFELGAGIKYYTVNNWEFSANYDYEAKEDYDGHSGYLRAGYKF